MRGGLARGISGLLSAAILIAGLALSMPAQAQSDRGFGDPNRGSAPGATGDLVPTTPNVVGGEIASGGSAQVVVLFRNESGQPVTTGAIQLYPSSSVSANVSLNQCVQEPLPSGAVCAVAVSVKGLQPGPWRVEMLMRHSGRSRLVTATMSGSVAEGDATGDIFKGDIEAIPDELDFGTLKASQPLVRAVVLRNIMSDPVDINAVYVEAAEKSGYALRTDCTHLESGQACVVTVTWSPVLEGQSTGVLIIEHTGPSGVSSINLNGDFTPEKTQEAETFPEAVPGKGLLVSSQDQIDFGAGIASTSAITVSLVNVGDAPLTLDSIKLASSDSAGLSVARTGCVPDLVLEPVEACPLTLTWSPVREGAIIDDVQIKHDGARGIMVLPVRGTSKIVISQDNKPVRLAGRETATIVPGDDSVGDVAILRDDSIDPASVLDGFVVTSHSPKRAIINGPGGSRIVFDGEEVVIGGFLWYVNIRTSGVEFRSGDEKVLLLFDRSLSSVNRGRGQSGGGSSSSGSSSGSGASSSTGGTAGGASSTTTTSQ